MKMTRSSGWICVSILAASVPSAPAQTGRSQGLFVSHDARAVAQGEVLLLTIAAPDGAEGVSGTAFGHPIATFPGSQAGTWHAVVGIDVDAVAGQSVIEVVIRSKGRQQRATDKVAIQRKQFGARKLTVDPRFVTPPTTELPRIDREQKLLADTLAVVSPVRMWHGAFVKPVDGAPASNFGQRSVFNGQPRGTHRGADFSSPAGAPIRAPGAGRVVIAQDLYYSGNTVVLDHGLGLFSLLAHMSRVDVRPGDVVAAGQVVGAVGATGRVTGPHLHWTLRIGNAACDPLSLLALKNMPE